MDARSLLSAFYDRDQEEMLKILKKHPELHNTSIGKNEETPFLLACAFEQPKVIDYLIEQGINPIEQKNSRGMTAVHYSSHHKTTHILEKLYGLGVSLDEPDHYGFTPLFGHFTWYNTVIPKFLIEHGVNVNHITKKGSNLFDVVKSAKKPIELSFFMNYFDKFNEENQRYLKKLRLKQLFEKPEL